ncbi:MAG: acyl-CoA dehydrogenase [Oceanicaulis sp.]|uniref:acyl-CoA dehydrogenase family protein n=1 Tax=Glycocaulis sp. TaxID=1969725 RepID=UPI0025BFFEC6|nr:acyl-CoA dehydrogenase [Glycocaulis sp.]MCC5980730.1 acyl-CoA dehydrogenase [Oceanicaulis sp.]MCH8521083.1 acyl-CoA dehydrogenase [Glycocaulis sp.]
MSFVLNEEEQMLRDSARSFLSETASVAALRKLRDENNPEGFSRDLWASMGEMGWCGILVEEAFGGVDMGVSAAGFILQEMGKELTSSPFLSTSVLAATALRVAGTEAQKSAWLPKIAEGKAVIGFAVDERARHNPDAINTVAAKDGNGLRLNGTKRFVANGAGADVLIVVAKTEDGAPCLVMVDPKADGVSATPRRTLDSQVPADFTFKDVKLDGDALMNGAQDTGKAIAHVLDVGRACLAAESLGVAERAFDITIDYIKGREQFGVPIASFQGLQHRSAHLLSEIELARSIVLKALRTLDETPSQAPIWAAAAKAKATAVSRLATSEGIQMHGGVGMTDEYDIGLYYKRAQAAGEFLGDDAWGAGQVAKLSGY